MISPIAATAARVLELTEHEPRTFSREELSPEEASLIDANKVTVDSDWRNGTWILTARGWAGFLPVSADLGIRLHPKVPLTNLFRMFEYAYRLKSLEFLRGTIDCSSLEEFYSRLADLLARRVLDRARRGFYRAYVAQEETLPYLRGNVELRRHAERPWLVNFDCRFEEHTGDVPENQILAWTLSRILRCSLAKPEVRPTVRRAFHAVSGAASPFPHSGAECLGRLYNRLNDDYEPLHLLCRFFLENSGPTHIRGGERAVPFLVDMNHLFELFLAEWLRAHLEHAQFRLKLQDDVKIGADGDLRFKVDILVEDAHGVPLKVIDAKYKQHQRPDPGDVTQVHFYARAKDCLDAVLVYPVTLNHPLTLSVAGCAIRTLGFPLEGDLETNGKQFLNALME